MTWDPSVFWDAFKGAGMLVEATYQPAAGAPVTLDVGFSQPDIQLGGELMQSTEYEIEYPTALLPAVKIGEGLTITGSPTSDGNYKIRSNPEAVGNGYFSKVKLTKI
jgi:hypothetical protein